MRNLAVLVVAATLIAAAAAASYNPSLAMSALYYCKSAYCSAGAIQTWTCGSCPKHPQFVVKNVYQNSSLKMQAFSGYDPVANQIVVAFRGSSNLANWIADLDFTLVNYPNTACSGCKVHRGFLSAWQSMQSGILADVSTLTSTYRSAQILVTGHSLGAAVSVHAALTMALGVALGKPLTVYNFGLPRVGNPTFAAWAASRLPEGNVFRVTHKRDPVPHLPPMSFGFLHLPHELWYDNDGATTYRNCADSVRAEDPKCSDSVIPFGITDHLLYLGVCTECTCSGLMSEDERLLGNVNVTEMVIQRNLATLRS